MNDSKKLDFPNVKTIFILGTLGFVLTYFATSSWFITPMYQSETIIYVPLFVPARQLENQGIGFASDKEIDGHIQILISGKMKDTLAHLFDLYNYYGIDPKGVGAKSVLYQQIDDRIKIQKTRYSSVSIEVEDKDPVMAAKMANTLVHLGDVIKEDLLSVNRRDAVDYASKIAKKQERLMYRLKQKQDSFKMATNLEEEVRLREVENLKDLLDREYQVLLAKRDNHRREQENMDTPLPTSYVITEAIPSNEPVWPPRLLLSLTAFVIIAAATWLIQLLLFSAKDKS
ncbi:hypothetical protein GC194_00835 [bacterium]|nr:hypothetical protein [bacterium]